MNNPPIEFKDMEVMLKGLLDQSADIRSMMPESGCSMSPWQLRLSSLLLQMDAAVQDLLQQEQQ